MELKELLANPGTAAFSRIKYLNRFGDDDQIKEFCNGLFLAAVECKYQGNWDLLNDFLERWEDTAIGFQFRTLKLPDAGEVPWARLTKPLDESRVALVTTGGVYLEGQRPFERGDDTYREIPRDTPGDRFRIWHPGYDTGPATRDINCIFPIDRFRELEAEGAIGELAGTNYSFMGLIPDPERLVNETAPEAARKLKEGRRRRCVSGLHLTGLQPVRRTGSQGDRVRGHTHGHRNDVPASSRRDEAPESGSRAVPLRAAAGRAGKRRPAACNRGGCPPAAGDFDGARYGRSSAVPVASRGLRFHQAGEREYPGASRGRNAGQRVEIPARAPVTPWRTSSPLRR
jgi:D-proline reductase (dithiol) PrdB